MKKYILLNNEAYDLNSRYSRKLLHQAVSDIFFVNVPLPNPGEYYPNTPEEAYEWEKEYIDDEVDFEEVKAKVKNQETMKKLQQAISDKDINVIRQLIFEFDFSDFEFAIFSEEQRLIKALEKAGYTVEESQASCSIYIQLDDDREIRISDHKRPAVYDGACSYDWEYWHEIVFKGPEVPAWVIEELNEKGVSIPKGIYYLE